MQDLNETSSIPQRYQPTSLERGMHTPLLTTQHMESTTGVEKKMELIKYASKKALDLQETGMLRDETD